MRLLPLFGIGLFCALLQNGLACVSLSYSLGDQEIAIDSPIAKLIMGEQPRPSRYYWHHEIRRTEAYLKRKPMDLDRRNDRAVALLKLGRYEESEAALLAIEDIAPGRYDTASNLGVLYKKMGDLERGVEFTSLALEIRPDGHLGLGAYYKNMLEWRAEAAARPGLRESINFLGIPRAATSSEVALDERVRREHLILLIQADHHFADAYAVLGDVLTHEGDTGNAERAYKRAYQLDPLRAYAERINPGVTSRPDYSTIPLGGRFGRETYEVETWIKNYQETEMGMMQMQDSQSLPPQPRAVLEVMVEKGFSSPVYKKHVGYSTTQKQAGTMGVLVLLIGVIVLLFQFGVLRLPVSLTLYRGAVDQAATQQVELAPPSRPIDF